MLSDRERAVRWLRVLGFCIYAVAFLLPACRDPGPPNSAIPGDNIYKGWFCAWITVSNTFSRDVWHSKDFLAVLSGWINPLILIYLASLANPRLVWPRRIAAALVIAFMFATWIYFALAPLVPLVGHVLWIAGALLILAGEVVRTRESAADYAAVANPPAH